jgi:hypothetical protein
VETPELGGSAHAIAEREGLDIVRVGRVPPDLSAPVINGALHAGHSVAVTVGWQSTMKILSSSVYFVSIAIW